MRKIRFKLLSKCDNKLQVVKLIKDCTGLGLNEENIKYNKLKNK